MTTSEIHEKNLGLGIDARNSENLIGPGYWESLTNAETDGNIVLKRRGYQQLGGYLPFRVQSVEYSAADNRFCFNLDNYIDLSRLRSSPIMARGTVRYPAGTTAHPDWVDGVFTEKYYSEFEIAIRRAGTNFTIPQAAHGHKSWIQHSNIFLSTSESDLTNEFVYEDELDINFTSLTNTQSLSSTDVQVNNISNYIHASIDASTIGTTNYYPNTAGVPDFTLETAGTTTMSFDASAVGLQSSNLIVSVYEKLSSTKIQRIIPDEQTITGTTLSIDLDTPSATGAEYFYVATAVPDAQVLAGQVTAASSEVIIPGVTPFTAFNVYTLSGSTRELVIPDTANYDDATKELTITFDTTGAVSYQIYYTAESLQVNQICVDGSAVTDSTSLVELDLYGIEPEEVMIVENRNHWISHIDTYRSSDLNQLITGVAGVEYKLDSTSLATLYPKYELILDKAQYLTPLFQDTGKTFTEPGRGYVTSTAGFSGPEITDIAYQSGTGYVRFTLSAPSLAVFDLTLTDIGGGLFTNTGDNDLLTVENAGYSIMNSAHEIKLITFDFNGTPAERKIYVDCAVTGVTNTDFDEADVGGYAQVYTTPFTIKETTSLLSDNTILPGATITVAGKEYKVRGNSFGSGSTDERLYLDEVTASTELSVGVFILGTVTASVLSMRDDLVANIDEYVRGDMIKYTSHARFIRIKDIIQLTSRTVTLTGNQVIFSTTGDALNFEAGQNIPIMTEGLEGAIVTVNKVVNATTLEVSKTFVAVAGRLLGQTFELDESLTVSDTIDNSLSFIPTARWHAIQKVSVPSTFDSETQTVKYPFNAFTTTQQAIVKSSMASDNIYMTNGEDALIKYDGLNISRAGLFRWEGATFVRKVDGSGGAIPYLGTTVSGAASIDTKIFTPTVSGEGAVFTVGQNVVTDTGQTVVVTSNDIVNNKITVTPPFSSAVTTLTESSTLKYYFRLNLIDANNNIIGSATSGVDNNYTIQMTDNTTVGIKLAKPPTLDLLDYERLEYDVYRTRQDGVAFFKVATISIDYTDSSSFFYFEDKVADESLFESDPVSTSTFGAELATAIDEPLRAQFVTSANNRLVLGKLKDSPRAEVQIFRPSTEQTVAQLDGLSFLFTTADQSIEYKFQDDSATTNSVTNITSGGVVTSSITLDENKWYYIYTDTEQDDSPEHLGWFKATAADTIAYSGPTIAPTNTYILAGDLTEIPVLASGEFNDDDAGYQSGDNQLLIQSKLINAINATQFDLDGFSLAGEGRTDIAELGKFSIKSLDNVDFTLTITSTNLFGVSSIFINNTAASSGVAVSSLTQNYASRMLVSFPNFPEIFDRPRAIIPEDSLSVIDVNSADGQEITGIIPFFGESTSQDSRKQDIVICFKENSIYAVNVSTRTITKIDSRGVGCNAPSSIAAVPNGIIFASRSGVYRLNRSFDVIWVGRYLDRIWEENTNLDQLSLATGHVYPQKKQYRLSVPAGSDERATEVYIYEYGDEGAGRVGGWSVFNNIPSTGWASDGFESYFGSSIGKVFTIRNTGTDSDFRDDDEGVAWEGLYRGMDFGAPGRRKIVRAIISHFRVLKTDSNTVLEVGVDLTDEFTPTTTFTLKDTIDDGLSTVISSKVKELKYNNSTIDTPVALAGITFHVAGLDHRGIEQAADTSE
jgi:hypothetical protein